MRFSFNPFIQLFRRFLKRAGVRSGRNFSNGFERIYVLEVLMLIGGAIIIGRLYWLQNHAHAFYQAMASDQHYIKKILTPKRGDIFVRDEDESLGLYPIATSRELALVYAVPKDIKKKEQTVRLLADVLDIEPEILAPKIYKDDDPYEPIKHKVDKETLNKVLELDLEGINYINERWRYYPEGSMAAHVLGFVGMRNGQPIGQYGIEGYYEEALAGLSGELMAEKDLRGRWIALSDKQINQAKDGVNIVLTLNRSIQYFACNKLHDYVDRFNAAGGVVIVMDPKTGAIQAMCGVPDFDLNAYNMVEDAGVYNNPAIYNAYEPGSIFKPVTMAAALDQGVLSPTDTYVDEGFVKIGKYTIRNVETKALGEQTMTEVLEKSLNTGVIFVSDNLGYKTFKSYVDNFGFGKRTDIGLIGESEGNISTLDKPSQIYVATASFGQGITVTPIQITTAYGALANGGQLMKPYIVDEIIEPDGTSYPTSPTIVNQVISPRASSLISGMLVSVIENGHAKTAKINGYYLAGKTGTAQLSEGQGYEDKTIQSFVGYGPIDDAEFVIFTRIDKPEIEYAVASAAPLFREIAEYILEYKRIPRDY